MVIDAVSLTQALIRMNTSNPPGNEDQCALYLAKFLEEAGFRISCHDYSPRRTSLVASIGGVSGKPPICFTGHLDTVPLGTTCWCSSPYAAEIDSDHLYGCGSSDMKSGVASFVAAAIALAPGLSVSAGLVLVITAGEETGCEGAFHLAELNKTEGILGSAGAIVIAEPTSNYPLVGHKGALWLQARSRGIAAHGSMPEHGVNAIYKAAQAVSLLEQFDFGVPAHPLMGRATLNVGTIRGGINVNSVPDDAVLGIDVRTIPGQSHSELLFRLRQHLGIDMEVTPFLDVESIHTNPSDSWVQSVYEVMTPILGELPQPRTVSYFTDAAALTKAYSNPPSMILGPGEPQMAHQKDEYCLVSRIEQAVDAYSQIIRNWCNK